MNELFGDLLVFFIIGKSLYSADFVVLSDCFDFCIDLDDSRSDLIRSSLIDTDVPSDFLFIAFVDKDERDIAFFKASVCSIPRSK
jgi:hypothetical protein